MRDRGKGDSEGKGMKDKIKKITKTCGGYPSQWEGKLENGKMIYIRYRWGLLDVRISKKPTDDILEAVKGKSIYKKYIGGPYDGVIEDEQLFPLLKKEIGMIYEVK